MVDALSTTSKARITGANCGKSNHSEDNRFKLKTCFKCKERGHIARFCKADNARRCTTSQIFKKIIFESKYFGKRINYFARHWESIFNYN